MSKYKVILYKLSVGNYLEEYSKSTFLQKDKFCSYDEILAHSLVELIPNCDFQILSDSDIDHESLTEFKINENDKFGITKNSSSEKFDLFDFIEIKNLETNKYVIIDFQDGPKHAAVLGKNDDCLGGYTCMYLDLVSKLKDTNFYLEKFYPFSFFDLYPYLTKLHREEILDIRNTQEKIPKLVFYGTIGDVSKGMYTTANAITGVYEPVRLVVKILKEKYPEYIDVKDREEKLSRPDWWRLAAKYSMAVTIPGHPWCSREHEFWALGIPTLANTFTCPLMFPLIGNKHYVDAGTSGKDSMDREIDQEYAADLLIERFLQVRDQENYLNKIAKNAQERYDKYNFPEVIAKHLLEDIKIKFDLF